MVLVASLGSGLVVGLAGWWNQHRLLPIQKRELEAKKDDLAASVQKTAVETAEAALRVANQRISTLEIQTTLLDHQIVELRAQLKHATSDRHRMQSSLDLLLSERARLQQQILDLGRVKGVGDLARVSPPDAIIMVSMKDWMIVHADDGVLSLLGYLPYDLIGKPLDTIVPDARRGAHHIALDAFRAHPQTRRMGRGDPEDLVALTATGGELPVDISLHPTGDGRVIALLKRRPYEPQVGSD